MNKEFIAYLHVYRPSFYEGLKVEYIRFKNEFKKIERQKQENAIAIKEVATYKKILEEKEQQEKAKAIKRQREAKEAVEAYKQKIEEKERQETAKSNKIIRDAKDALDKFKKIGEQATINKKRIEAVEKKPKRKMIELDDPNLCVCRKPIRFNKYNRGWCSHKCVENNISRYEMNKTEGLIREWCS